MKSSVQNEFCGESGHPLDLVYENLHFGATGGVSENNREAGFVPAFKDTTTGRVYRSRFANGAPAPIHILDGLPAELVVRRDGDSGTVAFKETLVSGFLRADHFFTREEAAELVTALH